MDERTHDGIHHVFRPQRRNRRKPKERLARARVDQPGRPSADLDVVPSGLTRERRR